MAWGDAKLLAPRSLQISNAQHKISKDGIIHDQSTTWCFISHHQMQQKNDNESIGCGDCADAHELASLIHEIIIIMFSLALS